MCTEVGSRPRSAALHKDVFQPMIHFAHQSLSRAVTWIAATVVCSVLGAAEPIRLHPDNPHYFWFRGKPTVLVTSGEHYGAVLNLDFDYVRYLETLRAHGLNQTRTFTGVFPELPGSFGIPANTLNPARGRYL